MFDHELRKNVLERKFELGSFSAIARKFGGSPALYWKIAKGQIAFSPIGRQNLGLPPLTVAVEPCQCGEVHTLKGCPGERPKTAVDRLAARVTVEQGERIREHLKGLGFNSITEYWIGYIEYIEKQQEKSSFPP